MGVRYAENLSVGDGGVLVKDILDLDRIDVLAASDRHVLAAADDVAIALGVERAEVSSVHPAVGVDSFAGFFWVVPVTKHD